MQNLIQDATLALALQALQAGKGAVALVIAAVSFVVLPLVSVRVLVRVLASCGY